MDHGRYWWTKYELPIEGTFLRSRYSVKGQASRRRKCQNRFYVVTSLHMVHSSLLQVLTTMFQFRVCLRSSLRCRFCCCFCFCCLIILVTPGMPVFATRCYISVVYISSCGVCLGVSHVRVLCRNGERYGHSCYGMRRGNCTHAFKWTTFNDLERPWVT